MCWVLPLLSIPIRLSHLPSSVFCRTNRPNRHACLLFSFSLGFYFHEGTAQNQRGKYKPKGDHLWAHSLLHTLLAMTRFSSSRPEPLRESLLPLLGSWSVLAQVPFFCPQRPTHIKAFPLFTLKASPFLNGSLKAA